VVTLQSELSIGDDADSIDLDITLEKYAVARAFLRAALCHLGFFIKIPEHVGQGAYRPARQDGPALPSRAGRSLRQ
jgi:hypothetical protein